MKRGEIALNVSRGAFFLALEKVVALVSGTLYFALLLRWMGRTKYGILTLATALTGFATLANGNFEVFLERYAAEYEAHGRWATLRRAHLLATAIKLGLGVIAMSVLMALVPWLERFYAMPELDYMLPVLALTVAVDGLSATARSTLYGMQRFGWNSLFAIFFHVSKTVMVALLWALHGGLREFAIGFTALTVLQGVVSSLVPMLMLWGRRDTGGEPEPWGALLGTMTRYCVPLLGARAAFMSGQNLGKLVLGKLFDAEQLGLFAFAFQTVDRFVDVLFVLPSALLPSLTKLVARAERERLRWVFDQAFRLIQVAGLLLSLGLFVFAPEITRVVGSRMFLPAVSLLRVLALVPIARTAQQPLTMLFQAMRQPGVVLRLALIKFGVEFGSYFTIVPWLGILGGGVATLAGAAVSFTLALRAGQELLPEGAGERLAAVTRALLLALPVVAVTLALDRILSWPWALAGRATLMPFVLLSVFALGLVTRYDLEKLSTLPLRATWLRVMRDRVVGAADRLARVLEPRGI
ncbi:MAG: lipopolysaccharide biosynthesis protein [Candidatus Eisenbacteria bacterium]